MVGAEIVEVGVVEMMGTVNEMVAAEGVMVAVCVATMETKTLTITTPMEMREIRKNFGWSVISRL